LSSNKGTLIIEVHLLEKIGHVWWVEGDLPAIHPDFPLAPIRVLDPSFEIEERFRLLHDDVSKAWWNTHLQELSRSVYLVQLPLTAWRQRDEILAIPGAVAVDSSWTHSFHHRLR